eukprot:9107024-Ditylum_brightwellii.AAC.1
MDNWDNTGFYWEAATSQELACSSDDLPSFMKGTEILSILDSNHVNMPGGIYSRHVISLPS